jgi:hypothetical protein
MPRELLADCIRARDRGADFRTIWLEILRIHPLVDSPAMSMRDGERAWLEIKLTNGQRLAFHEADGFSLLSRVAITLRAR